MKSRQGVTLLEVMLVLAVFGMILVISLRVYKQLTLQSSVDKLNANIDSLFQALGGYYQANCFQNPNVSRIAKLDPVNNPTIPQPLNIATDLSGYLAVNYPFPNNPITNTYVVQFNQYPQTRYLPGSTTRTIGTIYIWKPQVALQVGAANTAIYKNWMAADCVSSMAGSVVTPCSQGGNPAGDYLVWERLPSFASTQTNTDLWQSVQTAKQFMQMYSVYSITAIATNNLSQNYLCGG